MFTIRISRSSRRGRATRRRRGVAVLMFAVFMMLLMMFVAIAADFSRLYVARNALQTAADAGALAGAVQLMKTKTAAAGDTAALYAVKNQLFHEGIDPDDVTIEPGTWTDGGGFTSTAGDWSAADAVRAIVRSPVAFHFAPLFGFNGRTAVDTAVAWAGASVEGSSDCIKPWTIPLILLKNSIHAYASAKGIPLTTTDDYNLTTEEGQVLDQMWQDDNDGSHVSQLDFTMHQGAGKPDYNSGNFQSVAMPPACKLQPGGGPTYDCSGDPQQGMKAVGENIRTCTTEPIGIGDILMTQTGVATQPTIDAIEDFCTDYMQQASCSGVRVKASFFTLPSPTSQTAMTSAGFNQQPAKDGGNMPVEVRVMGSFIIQNVYKDPADGKAAITGRFVKEEDNGPVGPNPSLLQRVFLVK